MRHPPKVSDRGSSPRGCSKFDLTLSSECVTLVLDEEVAEWSKAHGCYLCGRNSPQGSNPCLFSTVLVRLLAICAISHLLVRFQLGPQFELGDNYASLSPIFGVILVPHFLVMGCPETLSYSEDSFWKRNLAVEQVWSLHWFEAPANLVRFQGQLPSYVKENCKSTCTNGICGTGCYPACPACPNTPLHCAGS